MKNIRFAPDIVFGLNVEKYHSRSRKKVIISVIDLYGREALAKYAEDYENKITEIAHHYANRGFDVVLMSFCKDEGDEKAIARILAKSNNEKIKSYYYNGDLDAALREISSAEIVIGTRFHSIVLGLIFGKKVLPIIYSNKTKNMLDDIHFEGDQLRIDEFSKSKVEDLAKYPTECADLSELRQNAEQHFAILDKFIRGEKQ